MLVLGALLSLPDAGCSSKTQDITEPLPSVTGLVQRETAPALDVHVELLTIDGRLITSTHTTSSGSYGIQVDASGTWEIKIVGNRAGDFDNLTRTFQFQAPQIVVMPPLDVYAYGAQAIQPDESTSAPAPSPIQPLTFRWTMPERPGASARVQFFDAAGKPVWYSNWLDTTQVAWNGLANQGAWAGHPAAAGVYTWRMKFGFPDSSEAHTAYRALTLK